MRENAYVGFTDTLYIFTPSPNHRSKGGKDVIVHHREQLDVGSFPKQMNEASEMRLQLRHLANALAEVYELLEDYAPTWYTLHHQERVVSALRSAKKF
ncbi:MAG: hypothetical protein DMG55_31725 [Acidobacteria bacterium]|nr:MAG: hypothetical protein DMG55_31725 [Acidobacteriota bacterium]